MIRFCFIGTKTTTAIAMDAVGVEGRIRDLERRVDLVVQCKHGLAWELEEGNCSDDGSLWSRHGKGGELG